MRGDLLRIKFFNQITCQIIAVFNFKISVLHQENLSIFLMKTIKNFLRPLVLRIKYLLRYLMWKFCKKEQESVFFFTFHKCASTLFSGYILKNIRGLHHVDYAADIFNDRSVKRIMFQKKGYVYGPLRFSTSKDRPAYKRVVGPASSEGFIKDKIGVFFLRDPRAILVSSYYSFGFTHVLSLNSEYRDDQLEAREEIQQQNVDQFVLQAAAKVLSDFEDLGKIVNFCERSTILKYEDMINNWEGFSKDLTKYFAIDEKVLTRMYELSRPRDREDVTVHQRSGQTEGFRSKLKDDTITSLNATFSDVLDRYGYMR